MGVAQLRVNHLGVALQRHDVANFYAIGVGRNFPQAQGPGAARPGQIDAVAPLLAGGRFTCDRGLKNSLPGSTIRLQVQRILDGITHHIAIIFLFHQVRPL